MAAEPTVLTIIAANRKYGVLKVAKTQALFFKSMKHEDMLKGYSRGTELYLHSLFQFPKKCIRDTLYTPSIPFDGTVFSGTGKE